MKKISPELLERYYNNTCTKEERETVNSWLNAQESQSPNEDRLLEESWEKIIAKTEVTTTRSRALNSNAFRKIAGMAAVFAILAFAGIYAYRSFSTSTSNTFELSTANNNKVVVERGQKRSLSLPDGSTVILNAESELQFPDRFSKDSRILYLKGHAHFNVQRDESRPFIIYTANSKTQVLGTSFDLKANSDSETTEIVVTHGKVRFSPIDDESSSVDLTVDNQGILLPNNEIQVNDVISAYLTAWKDNILIFENRSFAEIVEVLERWYAIEITVKNKELLDRKYTFTYDNPSLQELFERMRFIAQFEYTIDGNKVLIY